MTGLRKHPLYHVWDAMKQRCINATCPNYKWYGARGITICDRWLGKDGFVNFLEDMGPRPKGYSIDRINNDGNYEPGNCRWATAKQQANNKRQSKPKYPPKTIDELRAVYRQVEAAKLAKLAQ